VKAHSMKFLGMAAALVASLSAGCGEVARQGTAPSQLVVDSLLGVGGQDVSAEPRTPLISDILYEGSYYNDLGVVTLRSVLKDPGIPGVPAAPSALNAITIYRYHVEYVRSDGRNTPGVDVPHPFDSEVTFTLPAEGAMQFAFDIVRHSAKREAPLMALIGNGLALNAIARVTFYGRDQVGNDVSATASIQVTFANFGDSAE
jgi:hypothetical protein